MPARLGGCLIAALVLAGCNINPTSINNDASFSASISDNPAPSEPVAAMGAPTSAPVVEGTLTGKAYVSVYREPGGWQLVGDTTDVTVTLQSGRAVNVAVDAVVPAGTYTQARLYLDQCQIDLASGYTVEGAAVVDPLSIKVGGRDGYVVVLRQFSPLTVSEKAGGEINFDLGVRQWITDRTVRDLLILDEVVQGVVAVQVQNH